MALEVSRLDKEKDMRSLPLKLYTYIAKEFMAWFAGVLLILLALIFLLEFSELLRRAQGIQEATYPVLTEMAFLKLPYSLEELLPFGLFFAAILCLWRLNRNNELIIVRSVGVSAWQFLMPMALTAFLIGIVDLSVVNPLTSVMKKQYDRMDSKYLRQKVYNLNVSESGIWIRHMESTGSTIYHIGKVNLKQSSLYDVTLYRYDEKNHFMERIDAKEGWLIEDKLYLTGVWLHKVNHLPEKKEKYEILSPLSLDKLSETNVAPDSMSFWELTGFISLLEKSGLLRDEYKLYWNALLARILWLMAMIFLAGACTLHSIRHRKISIFIITGIVAGFGLYVLKDVTYVMGAASTIPVVLAAWTPAIITFLTGASALLYFEDG